MPLHTLLNWQACFMTLAKPTKPFKTNSKVPQKSQKNRAILYAMNTYRGGC
jgi:hypothetical protein